MAIPLKDHKVAGALPTTPQPNARYYVKNGNNVVEYVTDSSGNPFNLNGNAETPSQTGYTVFPIWAEESDNLSTNNRQWSFGNGATGNINIPLVACEIFAISFQTEVVGTSVEIDIFKNNTNQGTVNFVGFSNYIELDTPITFDNGDEMGFGTGVVTGTYTDARVCVWCRTPILGLKGDMGPRGNDGIPAQRVVFQLNGGYNINTSSAGTPITIGSILNGNIPNVTTSGSTVTLPDGVFDVTYTVSVNTTVQRSNQNFRLDVSGGQSYGKFGPLYIRSSSGHNSAGTDLKFPVTITGGGGACELFSIRESASGTTNIVGTSNLGGIEVPVSYLTIERKA